MKVLIFLITTLFISSCSLKKSEDILISAHKGLHNRYPTQQGNCPSLSLINDGHQFSENSMDSIIGAFDSGADLVEIDLRLTKDNQIIIFHDESLDCKTQLKGLVKDYTLEQLKQADLYYNISFDNGKSFPLRGVGLGKITTLPQVLKLLPSKPLHLNPKDKTTEMTNALLRDLSKVDEKVLDKYLFWGSEITFNILKDKLPHFGHFTTNNWQQAACLKDLKTWGILSFIGALPTSCLKYTDFSFDHNMSSLYPNLWPFPLLNVFHFHGIRIWAYGVDTKEQYHKVKRQGFDGIITPNIGLVKDWQ